MKFFSKLKIDLREEGVWQRAVFSGPINEDSKATLIAMLEKANHSVVLDLGAVTQVNSCGVRDWSAFLRSLKNGRAIEFDHVTDEIVRTMNMTTNFHFQLPVRSLYRAYGCDHCGHEHTILLRAGKDYQHGIIPPASPPVKCPGCGGVADAFESDDEYFMFLLSA